MPLEFPVPVLSVAKDAVRELEGREALSSLWALFTKCKESIKDGRRLENLSWRLWYRDMVATELEKESSLKDFWEHEGVMNEKLVSKDSTGLAVAASRIAVPTDSIPLGPSSGSASLPERARVCQFDPSAKAKATSTSRPTPQEKQEQVLQEEDGSTIAMSHEPSPICSNSKEDSTTLEEVAEDLKTTVGDMTYTNTNMLADASSATIAGAAGAAPSLLCTSPGPLSMVMRSPTLRTPPPTSTSPITTTVVLASATSTPTYDFASVAVLQAEGASSTRSQMNSELDGNSNSLRNHDRGPSISAKGNLGGTGSSRTPKQGGDDVANVESLLLRTTSHTSGPDGPYSSRSHSEDISGGGLPLSADLAAAASTVLLNTPATPQHSLPSPSSTSVSALISPALSRSSSHSSSTLSSLSSNNMHLRPESALSDTSDSSQQSLSMTATRRKERRRSSFRGRMIFELLPPPSFGASSSYSASSNSSLSAFKAAATATAAVASPIAVGSGSNVKGTEGEVGFVPVPVVTCAGKSVKAGEDEKADEEDSGRSSVGVPVRRVYIPGDTTGAAGSAVTTGKDGEVETMVFRLKGQLLTPTASMSDGDDQELLSLGKDERLAVAVPAPTTVVSQLPTPGTEFDEPQVTSSFMVANATTPAILEVQAVVVQLLDTTESTPPATAVDGHASTASMPTLGPLKTPTSPSSGAESVQATPSSGNASQMTLTLPRLVIVHPTPGPTPHPTPPVTPRFLMEVQPVAILGAVKGEDVFGGTDASTIPPIVLPDPALTDSPEVVISSPVHPPSEDTLVDDEVIPPVPITRRSSALAKDDQKTLMNIGTVLPSPKELIAAPSSKSDGSGPQSVVQSIDHPSKIATATTSINSEAKVARRTNAQSAGDPQSVESAQTSATSTPESSTIMSGDQNPAAHQVAQSTSSRGHGRSSSRAAASAKSHAKPKAKVAVGARKSLSRSRSRGSNVGELAMTGLAVTSAAPAAAPSEKGASPPPVKARPPMKRSQLSTRSVTTATAAPKSPPTPTAPTAPPPSPLPLAPSQSTESSTIASRNPSQAPACPEAASTPSTSTTGAWGKKNKPTFNIGSDEGSKSGSSVSGGVVEHDRDRDLRLAVKGKARLEPPSTATNGSAQYPQPPLAARPNQQPHPQQPHAQPEQPQLRQRRIVLASDDSDEDWGTETDVETESATESVRGEKEKKGGNETHVDEEDDDTNWSSEDFSTDEVQVAAQRGSPATAQQGRRGTSPQHGRPSPPKPATHANGRPKHGGSRTQLAQPQPQQMTRAQASRHAQALRAQHTVDQAALKVLEAQQKQKEMFSKKPVPSSEQLKASRSQSVGLLTQLMHPDPRIFPPTHPYRRNFSQEYIPGGLGAGLVITGMPHAHDQRPQRPQHQRADTTSTVVNGSGRDPKARGNIRRASADGYRAGGHAAEGRRVGGVPPLAPGLKPSKSSAALPVASQVLVGSVATVTATAGVTTRTVSPPHDTPAPAPSPNRSSRSASMNPGSNGGYRPRGKPVDQELEESSSDEEDCGRNGLQMSKSVAQQKLQAFAKRRGIKSTDRRPTGIEEDPVTAEPKTETGAPNASGTQGPAPPSRTQSSSSRQQVRDLPPTQIHGYLSRQAPTPIPMNHPYNLPPAPAPTTPRTTRRAMLQTEMSESLRRNLLWERQVHRQIVGPRRSQSTVLNNGVRPFTGIPAVVEVRLKKPVRGLQPGDIANERKDRRGSDGALASDDRPDDQERGRERALARNRSWANDYHTAGW